jgi:hypothetical protein
MKNKSLILAILVIFVSVSFIGCGGDSPKMVKEIKVTTASDGYILTWDAVGKNVLDYEVFAKQEDKASIFRIASGLGDMMYSGGEIGFSGVVTNQMAFTIVGNYLIPTANSDTDKWYAVIYKENLVPKNGKYYFGVRTISTTADYSNIKWTKDTYDLISIVAENIEDILDELL